MTFAKTATMDLNQVVETLAETVVQKFKEYPPSSRLLIGVAGVPGSGKSFLAAPLTERINHLLATPSSPPTTGPGSEKSTAVCVGMDGYHYTRKELDHFKDPAEAHRRRGAHHTFNAAAFVSFLSSLRFTPTDDSQVIAFPIFSHQTKDPSPSKYPIYPCNKIIVVEGLYLFLDLPPWSDSRDWWGLRIWLDVPDEVVHKRLVDRHLETGVETSREAAEERVNGSDMLNGVAVRAHLIKPDVVVLAREVDGGEKGEVKFAVE